MIQGVSIHLILRLCLTNEVGAWVTQLLLSISCVLKRNSSVPSAKTCHADQFGLASYLRKTDNGRAKRFRDRLPNVLSRFLELMAFSQRCEGDDVPMFGLGDLFLTCCVDSQTVSTKTEYLGRFERLSGEGDDLKFQIGRQVSVMRRSSRPLCSINIAD